jgi:hypothetical protein
VLHGSRHSLNFQRIVEGACNLLSLILCCVQDSVRSEACNLCTHPHPPLTRRKIEELYLLTFIFILGFIIPGFQFQISTFTTYSNVGHRLPKYPLYGQLYVPKKMLVEFFFGVFFCGFVREYVCHYSSSVYTCTPKNVRIHRFRVDNVPQTLQTTASTDLHCVTIRPPPSDLSSLFFCPSKMQGLQKNLHFLIKKKKNMKRLTFLFKESPAPAVLFFLQVEIP